MKVLAVRDDGAELVGDDGLSCGMLRSENGSAVMPVASALARGYWHDPAGVFGDASLRPEDEAMIRRMSEAHDGRMAA